MRYFIGNLIRGEVAEYYKTTCADLASRFGVEDVSQIVGPHITVKSPFDRHEIATIDDILALISDAPAIPITLSKWGHFGNRTIFLDVSEPPFALKDFMRNILSKLRANGIFLGPQESNPHIHMSIARFLKPDQYDEIWKYLENTPVPKFDIKFDNLTIFAKENIEEKAWKVLKTFPLMGK